MAKLKTLSLGILASVMISSVVGAEEAKESSPLSGFQIGIGSDMGLSVTARKGKYTGYLGDSGLAIDYRIINVPIEAGIPISFYVDGGGYGTWDGDLGLRAPVGINMILEKRWNIYVHAVPRLKVIDDVDVNVNLDLGVRYAF